MSTRPLFADLGNGRWQPAPYARGPFDGLQGGALAGLMCAVAETCLPKNFRTVGIDARYWRPTPLAEVIVTVVNVQIGGRLSTVDISLASEGKERARAVVSALAPVTVEGLPPLVPFASDPACGVERRRPARHGQPWLMDRMAMRVTSDNTFWFAFADSVTGHESPFARALCSVDWLPGISRPDSFEQPLVRASPNIDLSVRMRRYPVGEWVGLAGRAFWHS